MADESWIKISKAYRLVSRALRDRRIAERRLLAALSKSKIAAKAEFFRVYWQEGVDADQIDLLLDAPIWSYARLNFGKDAVDFDVGPDPAGYYLLVAGNLTWSSPVTTRENSPRQNEEIKASINESGGDDGKDELDDLPTSYKAHDVRLSTVDLFREFPTARPVATTEASESKVQGAKSRGGRPIIYDWVAAAAFVGVVQDVDGCAPSTKELMSFFDKIGKTPDIDDIAKFIRVFREEHRKRMGR
ncbi:hypothetical protein [Mesorhizobium sp. CO1-1-8]|uniref:hypothetical protein n=1 Tax=Mesorhizobium sp. CO1-1-8 TaxID=2876631 RepID=UPI001CD0C557|nr:hypothetical protein [Mesorhizobium sp. CO1-1-8]MBZ9774005.1 hypothetical protein [Mesorhizobium sp. CO1-1-8]